MKSNKKVLVDGAGRLVLRAANFSVDNDLYGAVVGAYTLWGLCLALRHMLRLARQSNFQVGSLRSHIVQEWPPFAWLA